jgi:hypothetical protein
MILAFVAGWFVYDKLEAEKLGKLARQSDSLFKRPHSPTYGPLTARVRIVEFFAPACETCRRFLSSRQKTCGLALRKGPAGDSLCALS